MRLPNSFVDAWAPRVLSVLRIVVGFLYMSHGMEKLFGLSRRVSVARSPGVADRRRRHPRVFRRRFAADRLVHPARGVPAIRRNGYRLFHGACAAWLLADREQR